LHFAAKDGTTIASVVLMRLMMRAILTTVLLPVVIAAGCPGSGVTSGGVAEGEGEGEGDTAEGEGEGDVGEGEGEGEGEEGTCVINAATPEEVPDGLPSVACRADFEALASQPLDATLPGARSAKVGIDRADNNELWFQNSNRFQIHHQYCTANRSGGDLPIVGDLGTFNASEYFSPDRRFVLGAVTYYEGPGIWALEISPYDTASAEMITDLFRAVQASAFFGSQLRFHPTSEAVDITAADLPDDIVLATTDELYEGIDYQPLSLGRGIGRLRFQNVIDLADVYLAPTDMVVLDQAPNDISVVQGLVTEEFQTPLSHVNILAQNRRTPNMGLRGAMTDPVLRSFEGRMVELITTSTGWTMREVTQAEADEYFANNRPEPIVLPPLDLTKTDIIDIDDVTPEPESPSGLRANIANATRAFGGKAAQYSILRRTEGVPIKAGFAVPIYFYDQFMRENGFYERIAGLLADEAFRGDAEVRFNELAALRDAMLVAPLNPAFEDLLRDTINNGFADRKVRFRTSTNSEDLDGFPCAGCYESHTADPNDWADVQDAVRETWSTTWLYRTFEERSYYGVDHTSVGMALLCHSNFPEEEANGVAVTNNPFDPSGLSPALYVNVQTGGEAEVVAPPPGVSSDQFLVYFSLPNQPISFISRSNLIPTGTTVLNRNQVFALGTALSNIHLRFAPAYSTGAWYAMDVEFKFDDDGDGQEPRLFIKQARPYPGRSE
jgi:hypothetical protein